MVSVWVRFLSFYSEFAPIYPSFNMLQTLLGREKYEEAMSDEHPLKSENRKDALQGIFLKTYFILNYLFSNFRVMGLSTYNV